MCEFCNLFKKHSKESWLAVIPHELDLSVLKGASDKVQYCPMCGEALDSDVNEIDSITDIVVSTVFPEIPQLRNGMLVRYRTYNSWKVGHPDPDYVTAYTIGVVINNRIYYLVNDCGFDDTDVFCRVNGNDWDSKSVVELELYWLNEDGKIHNIYTLSDIENKLDSKSEDIKPFWKGYAWY